MFTKIYLVLCSIILVEVAARERLEHRPTLGNELSRKVRDTNEIALLLENAILETTNAIKDKNNERRNDSKFRNLFDGYNDDVTVTPSHNLQCWAMDESIPQKMDSKEKKTNCLDDGCATIIVCFHVQSKDWACSYVKNCMPPSILFPRDKICRDKEEEVKKLTAANGISKDQYTFKCEILTCKTDLCNNEKFNTQGDIAKRLGFSTATRLKMNKLLVLIPALFFIF